MVKREKGSRFGLLEVIEDSGKRYFGSRILRVRCDCGSLSEVRSSELKPGNKTLSCGCIRAVGVVSDRQKAAMKDRVTRIRSERTKNGLCLDCSQPVENGVRCKTCKEKNASAAREKRRRKRETGTCLQCSKEATTGIYCLKHYFSRCASDATGKRSDGIAVEKIWKRQGGKCAYTGEALVAGENASLDHKVPKSRGGANKPENLQWVTLRVNVMKNDLTHDEFVSLVSLMAKRQKEEDCQKVVPPPLYRWGRSISRPKLEKE